MIGRNGAGKTTTLLSIMGIARPGAGRSPGRRRHHAAPDSRDRHRRASLGAEERGVLPNLTVLENLRLGMYGDRRRGLREAARGSSRVLSAPGAGASRSGALPLGRRSSRCWPSPAAWSRGPGIMLWTSPPGPGRRCWCRPSRHPARDQPSAAPTIPAGGADAPSRDALSHRLYVDDPGRIQFEARRTPCAQDPTIATSVRFLQPRGSAAAACLMRRTRPRFVAGPSSTLADARIRERAPPAY